MEFERGRVFFLFREGQGDRCLVFLQPAIPSYSSPIYQIGHMQVQPNPIIGAHSIIQDQRGCGRCKDRDERSCERNLPI
jgi:hypothetical protein